MNFQSDQKPAVVQRVSQHSFQLQKTYCLEWRRAAHMQLRNCVFPDLCNGECAGASITIYWEAVAKREWRRGFDRTAPEQRKPDTIMRRRAAHEEILGHEELEPQLPSKEEREVARKARTHALRKAKWERMLAAVRCPDDRAESSSSSCNSSGSSSCRAASSASSNSDE